MSRGAIFLDRDGVLCVEKSYVTRTVDLEPFNFARDCVDDMHKLGFLCVVVTNQSGVARGSLPIGELLEMNRRLMDEIGVDAVYFCPHYEKGKVAEYSIKCDCRKPLTGMIDRARRDFDIDMASSYMVGDRASDIMLGEAVGVKTVLLESGYGTARLEAEVRPDHVMRDLAEFAKYITKSEAKK